MEHRKRPPSKRLVVSLLSNRKDATSAEAEAAEWIANYLRLADLVDRCPKGGNASMFTPESRVKIKTYTPLTFLCAYCSAVFDVSVKSGEEVEAEIEQHMRDNHCSEAQAA